MREPVFVARVSRYYHSFLIVLFFWAMGWYERIFSRAARLLLIVYLICALLGSLSTRSPALVIFFCMSAAAAADLLCGWIFKPSLEIRRTLPKRVSSGAAFAVQYRIRNKSKRRPAADLLTDPYFESQNLSRIDDSLYMTLRPGESRMTTLHFLPSRRGMMQVPCCLVESSFPFNIFKHASRTGGRESLLVHPFHLRLHSLPVETGFSLKRRAMSSIPLPGESMDFHGCRRFQTGDSIRKIDWRSSAKHNRLIVKEFQQEQQSRAVIFVDSYSPSLHRKFSIRKFWNVLSRDMFTDDNPQFEGVLSMAASIATTLGAAGYHISHFAFNGKIRHFGESMAGSIPVEILDELACVKPSFSDSFPELTRSVLSELKELENVFLVLMRYDESVKSLRYLLSENRIHVCPVLVTDNPPKDLPSDILCFKPKDILAGAVDTL